MAEDKKIVRRVKAGSSDDSSKSVGTKSSHATKKNSRQNTTIELTTDESGRQVSRKMAEKLAKRAAKHPDAARHFVLLNPIFAIGRYFRDSWKELRAVEWTNRRSTWALTLAVLAFTAFLAVLVLLLDWVFQMFVKNVIL